MQIVRYRHYPQSDLSAALDRLTNMRAEMDRVFESTTKAEALGLLGGATAKTCWPPSNAPPSWNYGGKNIVHAGCWGTLSAESSSMRPRHPPV
jgi:hypothetical protein